jgi:hypothetical protein
LDSLRTKPTKKPDMVDDTSTATWIMTQSDSVCQTAGHCFQWVCLEIGIPKSESDAGFHSHGGTPKWLVYFVDNPKIKWMRTGGTPIFGNLHIVKLSKFGAFVT